MALLAGPVLSLGQSLLDQLRAAAEAAYPEECCGLVIGRQVPQAAGAGSPSYVATRLVAAANRHAEPRIAFELDPATHLGVLRQLRQSAGQVPAECLLGHYHSHPEGPATPSPRDRQQATEPDHIWVIIGLAQGRAQAISAWQAPAAADADFTAVTLVANPA